MDSTDRALAYAKKALQLATVHQYKKGVGDANARLAVINRIREEYTESLACFKNAYETRIAINDTSGANAMLQGMGTVHMVRGNYREAIGTYQKALERSTKAMHRANIAHNLGIAYEELFVLSKGPYLRKSIFWFREALSYYRISLDSTGMSRTLNSLGAIYIEAGVPDTAIQFLHESLKLKVALGDSAHLSTTCSNLGILYWEAGKTALAKRYLSLAIEVDSIRRLRRGVAETYYNWASLCLSSGLEEDAETFLNKAIHNVDTSIASKLSIAVLESLSKIQFRLEDCSGAVKSLRQAARLKVEIRNERFHAEILDAQTKYETEKKERENVELRAENAEKDAAQKRSSMFILILVLGFIIFGASGGFMYYRKHQKALLAEKNEQIKQQEIDELMQKQEISAMSAMMEGQEKERKRIAQDLHDRIGSQLAAVKLNMEALEDKVEKGQAESMEQFGKTYGLLDHLVEEVRKISHNMVSGVLMKFGLEAALRDLAQHISGSGKIKIEVRVFNLDERIDGQVEIAIYRVVQELVANALKHAQAQLISISLNRQDNNLNVVVEDDGKGFDLALVEKGMGLENIRQRVEALEGKLNIDAKPGRGTTVIVDVPIKSSSHA